MAMAQYEWVPTQFLWMALCVEATDYDRSLKAILKYKLICRASMIAHDHFQGYNITLKARKAR